MWWKNTVFYQIYVPGFKDTDGDGTGDFKGIISELDYLGDLGIGALWLTPFYPSPMVDNGYDISDYTNVDSRFGTLKDFDMLVHEAGKRDIKLIIDMVMNHTSTLHPWFAESRSSQSNSKRDWYIWRKKAENNWQSFFGGSAWEKDTATNEYYYHAFAPQMADLDWDCPDVRHAMYDIIRFWLNKGVRGLRLDVVNALKSGLDWQADNPSSQEDQIHVNDVNGSKLWEIFKEIRDVTQPYGDIYLLGEVISEDASILCSYTDPKRLDSVLSFNLGSIGELDLQKIGAELEKHNQYFTSPDSQTTLFFSSHDISRFATRLCKGNPTAVKGLAAIMLTAPGIVFLYQGDETGIDDYSPSKADDFYDVKALNTYKESLGACADDQTAFVAASKVCRDYSRALYLSDCRTKDHKRGSLVPQKPPFGEDIRRLQQDDQQSFLSWYRSLIQFRRQYRVLREGDFQIIESSSNCLIFRRFLNDFEWITAVNLSHQTIVLPHPYQPQLCLSSRPFSCETVMDIPGDTTLVFGIT